LAGTAAAAAVLGFPASAAYAESTEQGPSPDEVRSPTLCGDLGTATICFTVRQQEDVAGLQYIITNNGDQQATFTVSYTDVNGGPTAPSQGVGVPPGESVIDYFYGELEHCFILKVCVAGTDQCLVLGPACATTMADWPMPD
jgi:hypothetical protein